MRPKYLEAAEERIRLALPKLKRVVLQAQSRSLNEADTRDIVKAMIGDLLGFDMFFEVTGEYSIKGQYADFAVRNGESVIFFVEVKSVGTALDEKHLFQVVGYAANYGVEWAVLTNSARWVVYRLFATDSRGAERVLDVDVAAGPQNDCIDAFLALSKEGFRQGLLGLHYQSVQALNPVRIGSIACQDAVLDCLRREIRKSTGHNLSVDAIRGVLLNQVMRGDISDQIKGAT